MRPLIWHDASVAVRACTFYCLYGLQHACWLSLHHTGTSVKGSTIGHPDMPRQVSIFSASWLNCSVRCSTGWLTSWGEAMANVSFLPPDSSPDPYHDPKYFIGGLNAILRYANNSGNVNFYMAFGGTNFGWWQGGLADAVVLAVVVDDCSRPVWLLVLHCQDRPVLATITPGCSSSARSFSLAVIASKQDLAHLAMKPGSASRHSMGDHCACAAGGGSEYKTIITS